MVNRTLLIVLAIGGVAGSAVLFEERERSATPTAAGAAATSEAPPIAPASVTARGTMETTTSPELERLASRRELYESIDALVQASEFEKARRLLDDAQTRFGEDSAPQWRDLEQSYRLMADCLERPTPSLRSRAQAFVVVSEAPGLKPRILSACGLSSR
jgi:hypothetical protein